MKKPDNVPCQFYLDRDLYVAARKKAKDHGMTLAVIMRSAVIRFVSDPVDRTLKELKTSQGKRRTNK